MTAQEVLQAYLKALLTCPVILNHLPACPANCPHKAVREEKDRAVDAVLLELVRGEI